MTEHRLDYRDMQVYYWTAGSPDKTALVLLHPAFGDHTLFGQQISHFEKEYFVLAVDMVAHGKSQPQKIRVDMGCMPEIIAGILDKWKVEKAHVAGVSLGSIVAQAFAAAYPKRTLSVTIVGGYSIHKDNRHIQKAQSKEILKWVFMMLTSLKKLKEHVVSMSTDSEEGRDVFTQAIKSFTRRSFSFMGGMKRFFVDREAPVDYPLLILCGEHDTPLALDAGSRLVRLEPHSRFVVIKDAGHCANIDNPTVFNRELEGFLNQVD